jgi:hypothetical protein
MSISYTNRKGLSFYLCQGVTKTGKPRYYFAREPKDQPVEQIPAGFTISESVNGIVSLSKAKPRLILPAEVAAVESAVQRHRKSRNYRVSVKPDEIQIYELVGPDPENLITALRRDGLFRSEVDQKKLDDRIRAERDRYGQFTPVLRFILSDKETRSFRVMRMCYLGSMDDWIDVGPMGSVDKLARRWIPRLGTDAFFATNFCPMSPFRRFTDTLLVPLNDAR